jgi:cytochrome c553
MCHNGRTAPKLDNMSKKEIIQKLLAMKNSKTNPKMAFIKYMSNKEIKQMVNQLKEKK